MKILIHIIVFCLLTLLTQIGGIVYLISLLSINKHTERKQIKFIRNFISLYLFTTYLIIPYTAPLFGREKIQESDLIKVHSLWYKLANRNYVTPKLNKAITNIANKLHKKHNGIKVIYLDANFPFITGFPLLPHSSHNDGKKVDISLIYEKSNGTITNKKRSISGYGVFENPKKNEYNQNIICKQHGNWKYDFTKYLTLGKINNNIKFSNNATRNLINIIIKEKSVEKLFIEPHLKHRLKLANKKIRFHGCKAVRHDDHIHFQVK